MDTTKKYALGISSIVLVGTLAFGSIASAAGNDEGTGGQRSGRPHLTTEQKCERQEQVAERAATLQQRITERLAKLNERRDAAETAGDTELVAKLEQRITRTEKVQQRVQARYAKYTTWVGEHC